MLRFVVLDTAGSELINTITCPFVRINSKAECWKPEYMVIVRGMDAILRFEDTERRVHVTKQEADEGEAWKGHVYKCELEDKTELRYNLQAF